VQSGEFPQAVVAPILKKGDPTKEENYRPVSCMSVASKVLEKIVCDQVTHYMEIHGLLPEKDRQAGRQVGRQAGRQAGRLGFVTQHCASRSKNPQKS
jgi:hypothetical protein